MDNNEGDNRPVRERYPGPYRIEQTPSGYRVMSGKLALAYVYVHALPWENFNELTSIGLNRCSRGGVKVDEFAFGIQQLR